MSGEGFKSAITVSSLGSLTTMVEEWLIEASPGTISDEFGTGSTRMSGEGFKSAITVSSLGSLTTMVEEWLIEASPGTISDEFGTGSTRMSGEGFKSAITVSSLGSLATIVVEGTVVKVSALWLSECSWSVIAAEELKATAPTFRQWAESNAAINTKATANDRCFMSLQIATFQAQSLGDRCSSKLWEWMLGFALNI
jgi:hypothetical protein